jgi:hypothetical protein
MSSLAKFPAIHPFREELRDRRNAESAVGDTVRRKLDHREGAFDLGRFEVPIAVDALAWMLLALLFVIVSAAGVIPVLIVVGLMLAGGAYFAYPLKFQREVLSTSLTKPTSFSFPG